jgi:PAS domain S-box-containing protein
VSKKGPKRTQKTPLTTVGRYTLKVTADSTDNTSAGTTGPSGQVFVLGAIVAVWLVTVGVQGLVSWQGDQTELAMLVGANALVTTLGAWLFDRRWFATMSRYDRRIRNVYLPLAGFFLIRLAVAPLPIPPTTLAALDGVGWLLSHAAAVTAILAPIRNDFEPVKRSQILHSGLVVVASLVVATAVLGLQRAGIPLSVKSSEVALAVAFAASAVLVFTERRGENRQLWFGVGLLLAAGSHAVLATSRVPYDGPVMWGLLLFVIALATPVVGAIGESVVRLENQDVLRERLTRLRRRTEILLDTLPAMVLSVDRDRELHYANRRARAVLGITTEAGEDAGRGWLERIHPHDRPQVHAAVSSVLSRPGGVWEAVIRAEDIGGGVHWLSTQMHQVVDPVENQTLVQVVATEVTDLFLARQSAEAQQSRLAFLSNLAQSVAGEVSESKILERYFETGQQIVPMKFLLLYRPLPGSNDLRLVASTGPGSEYFDHHRHRSLEGDEHPCRTTFRTGLHRTSVPSEVLPAEQAANLGAEHDIRHIDFLPLLAAGGVIGVLVMASSLPPKIPAEDMDLLTQIGFLLGGTVYVAQLVRELNEQRAVAVEASRLKSEFLANTSHELRTPLTAILGFLRLVIDGTVDDPDKQREYLGIAHDSAEKLLTIINDVLDLAKIEAGRLEVHQGPVPVRSVLEGVEILFKHQMKNKGINFGMPGESPGLVLWADPDRTTQILTNLLSNAMKFTPTNGSIDVDCSKTDGIITFTVTDSGAGIPESEIERVFSSFYQVDGSTTREHGGTGLGLTISRRLAELMGGTLGLESEGLDRGTTARLCLPAYRGESPDAMAEELTNM